MTRLEYARERAAHAAASLELAIDLGRAAEIERLLYEEAIRLLEEAEQEAASAASADAK